MTTALLDRTRPPAVPAVLGPDLDDALAAFSGRPPRVLTGDRPTGPLHLGHHLGTLRHRVALQQAGAELLVVIADLQVITDRERTPDGAGSLTDTVLGLVADQLACGLDPDRTAFFPHSAVPALQQLMLPFLSLVTDAELRRNPTVKTELADSGRSMSGLLLTYPVHQAADILFCHADLVPVGKDQLPHLEIARLIARRFTERYGPLFTAPSALLSTTPVLPGTDGRKMAKSRGNAIALCASDDETAAVIRAAVTDSERYITYAPARRPGVSALLEIAGACEGVDPRVVAEQIGNGGAAALKRRTTDAVCGLLAPIRARRRELAGDRAFLVDVLRRGTAVATAHAEATLDAVGAAMGMDHLR